MEVFFGNESSEFAFKKDYEDFIVKSVEEVAKQYDLSDKYQVSITIVDEDKIQNINKIYRGIDKVTDVISFALNDDEDNVISGGPEEQLLGEILICIQQAIRQAEEYNHSVKREVSYLTVHGMLHLLGYDHINDEEKSVMRKEEEYIMSRLDLVRE